MGKGYSIHFGVNQVDSTNHYKEKYRLRSCVNDAKSMQGLCKSLGYTTSEKDIFLDQKATSNTILTRIKQLASKLNSGDILLISMSSHGTKVGSNETWVLYDRMLFDIELKNIWSLFKKGVRILVVSDSCFSGDIIRLADIPFEIKGNVDGEDIYSEHKAFYDTIIKKLTFDTIRAHIKLMSSSTKDELSYALKDSHNSLFTESILNTWKASGFCGNYEWLKRLLSTYIHKKLEKHHVFQTPCILNIPTSNSFDQDIAFKI